MNATLLCKVTPNAQKSVCFNHYVDDYGRTVWQIRLAAPAVEGKANAELLVYLSKKLGCSKSLLSLRRGSTSRVKTIELPEKFVNGMSLDS